MIYMEKKLLISLFILIACFLLAGCEITQKDSKKEERTTATIKDKAELNEIENVSMTIKNGTLTRTSATIIINDANEIANTYGSEYRIDKKEKGSWKEADIVFTGNYGWNSIGYNVDENHQLEMDINWKNLYGSLENGEYRIVKNIFFDTIDINKKYFSVEFSITE